jgi:sRNA-binding protein
VAWYRSHIGYLKSCVAGASRIDLQGKSITKVTPTEAHEAEDQAQEGIARMAARRKERPLTNGLPAFVAPQCKRRANRVRPPARSQNCQSQ